jgi:hypothetical protein
MAIHRISVGGKRFFLEPDQDIASLKHDITQAVLQGGAFVRLASAGDSSVDVLITPELSVWLEEMDAPRAEAEAPESEESTAVFSEYEGFVPDSIPA